MKSHILEWKALHYRAPVQNLDMVGYQPLTVLNRAERYDRTSHR